MVSIRKLKEEVKKEGEEPFFTKGLVDKWLGSGEKLVLQCTVIGNPKPEIRWYTHVLNFYHIFINCKSSGIKS